MGRERQLKCLSVSLNADKLLHATQHSTAILRRAAARQPLPLGYFLKKLATSCWKRSMPVFMDGMRARSSSKSSHTIQWLHLKKSS